MRQKRFVFTLSLIVATMICGYCGIATAEDAPKTREPGGALTVGATASATVKAIDADKRTVTLQTDEGETFDVKCGTEVRNFDQIKVGDQVKAAAIGRLVVALGKAGGTASRESSGTMVARAPKGGRPGAIIVHTQEFTAKVDAVDPTKQTVTLSGLDDKPQPIQVAPDVDLSGVKVGDEVTVRVSKGAALWVARPGAEAQPAAATAKPEGDGLAGFALDKATTTATVESIDSAKRIITLKSADGSTRSLQLGKEYVNFDQIKVGDQVRATLAQEVAVSVRKAGSPGDLEAAGRFVALAPKGAKPGIIVVETDEISARIKSIDASAGTITLSEPDGTSRTVKAASGVKLSELKAGDEVTARVTQRLAIVVQTP